MKQIVLISILLGLLFFPLACTNSYNLAPLSNTPTPTKTPIPATPVFTPTSTPWGGTVTTIAGSAGVTGATNGTASTATFSSNADGIAVDASGNVYVSDTYNNLIRKITPGGIVSTFAGSGAYGTTNGTGTAASFNMPAGMTIDSAGNLYVVEYWGDDIRKITPGAIVTTFAGISGFPGSANGVGTAASFWAPYSITIDSAGNLYVGDWDNEQIRKITPGALVSTLAGQQGVSGSANGAGTVATFDGPDGLAVDASGNVYVADVGNALIRKITPAGVVSTFAGSGSYGSTNGLGTAASFEYPCGLTIDSLGNLYVADSGVDEIRAISPAGLVTTFAGSGGYGSQNGAASIATFGEPNAITIDSSGNIYTSDSGTHLIRKITP